MAEQAPPLPPLIEIPASELRPGQMMLWMDRMREIRAADPVTLDTVTYVRVKLVDRRMPLHFQPSDSVAVEASAIDF